MAKTTQAKEINYVTARGPLSVYAIPGRSVDNDYSFVVDNDVFNCTLTTEAGVNNSLNNSTVNELTIVYSVPLWLLKSMSVQL